MAAAAPAAGGILAELWYVLGIVVPVFLQLGLNGAVKNATLGLVGHYDPSPDSVAAAALGSMYGSITGLSVGMGITLAVGSYCAENYGSGATLQNGVVVRHCFTSHMLCFVFAVFMAEMSPTLLHAFRQPEELLQPVRQFALISAFAWPGNWIFMCLSTVLSSQDWQTVGVVGQALGSITSLSLSWWLLFNGSGYLGIAIANVAAAWVSVVYIVVHICAQGLQSSVWRSPWSLSGTLTFWQYLRSALPMAASIWVEWWALEILALFAGWLPGRQRSLAAHSILFNMLSIFYMAFVAVSRACMFRVGHQIGARDVPGIRRSLNVCMGVAASMSLVVAACLDLFGGWALGLYTRDDGILSVARPATLGVALSIPPYAVVMCLMGALRSAGLQLWGAEAMFISYYAVGLPIGYYVGVVRGVGLFGVWLGNVTALSCAAASTLAKISCIDWDAVVEKSAVEEARGYGATERSAICS